MRNDRTIRTITAATIVAVAALAGTACTQDIPQAHKGRIFDRTGALTFYLGGDGFTGPVRGPGTHFVGLYDTIGAIDCGEWTQKEKLESLTKDNVQFGLDVYVRFHGNCTDEIVATLLATLTGKEGVITKAQLYQTYVYPALGPVVRDVVSPHNANDINAERDEIFAEVQQRFSAAMAALQPRAVIVSDIQLSNLDFPDKMDVANTERAVQAVLRDKAIAERERVEAETTTEQKRIELRRMEGTAEAAKIDEIGAALRRNPDFLQYALFQKMPEIYEKAGANGNLVITAPNPTVLLGGKGTK